MNSIDSILGMIATEAAEDVLTPQERRREVKEEMSVERLVEAFGNASFDCGHWRDKEDVIPSAGNPEWEPYEQPLERWIAARAALLAHVEELRQEIATTERLYESLRTELRAENERLKHLLPNELGEFICDHVGQVQQLEQRNAELRAKTQAWINDLESVNDGQVHGDPQQTIKLVVGSMKAALNVEG